ARHRLGAGVCFESAATLAAGSYTIPVYEIFKVGEDLHWQRGLDLLAPFGLSVVFVPHWDNTDGGAKLDTSRCYIGQARFEPMVALLPPGQTIVGIDDHTALAVRLARGACQVMGAGGVTIIRDGEAHEFEAGATFPLQRLGDARLPASLEEGIRPDVWQAALDADAPPPASEPAEPPDHVVALIHDREAARRARDWQRSDALRAQIAALGWRVEDTREGPRVRPIEPASRPA
ncbi:MAG: hypothetical protein NZ518_09985, partial [Dehalococcoidia bacterium]|nr:hypothetical protein [Dehalococcoidia bacterium]